MMSSDRIQRYIDHPSYEHFECFKDDPSHRDCIGDCRHHEPPADGVWKMAPRHFKMLEDLLGKYECLASYASGTWDSPHPAQHRYPKEFFRLNQRETGCWQRGYDYGMLASLRLVRALLLTEIGSVKKIENWEEERKKEEEAYMKLSDIEKDKKDYEDSQKLDETLNAWFAIQEYPFLDS